MIRLSSEEWTRLKNAAAKAQAIENKWVSKVESLINSAIDQIKEPKDKVIPPDFEGMFIAHWFETYITALKIAENESELDKKAPRLASKPKTLAEIMKMYDLWRKGKFKPKGPTKRAKEMKDLYIKSVNRAWKKYSEDFREGGETTQAEIKEKIKESAQTTISRAQTIVRTETTRYYNQARRDYYDKAPDVTHYLFLAIRDKATTPWCTSQTVKGKRGRSGLVYAKTDPLLKKETPPIHWNCRSELLPLNRFNPTHKKMIEDNSINRRSHQCTPLPPEWVK